jgi:hypothetical protein
MSRAQEAFVLRWWELNKDHPRREWDTPTAMVYNHPMGLIMRGNSLREPDTTILAEVVRTNTGPICRLVLPNQLTIGRHRLIRKVVERAGGTVLAVPGNVVIRANIDIRSIEVIATRPTKAPLRANEELIRAYCSYDYYSSKWEHQRGARQTYFLSGFDLNERRLSYFFCELPPDVHPTTVAEAYEALKPQSVVIAEKEKRKIKRQGDMFLIRTKWKPDQYAKVQKRQYVHGTNHQAELYCEYNGMVYVKGNLFHRPLGRRPDHKTLHLGYRWYLCVKNTVPVTR